LHTAAWLKGNLFAMTAIIRLNRETIKRNRLAHYLQAAKMRDGPISLFAAI
jgi:hypothetical protein